MAAYAGGRGRLRASDSDRDQAVEVLKAAFVQERLAKEEFDLRVGQVLTARTYADLDALIAAVPAGLTAAVPAGLPLPEQPAAAGAQQRENLVAREPSAGPPDHRNARAFALITLGRAWRPVLIVAGLLLMGAGVALPSVVAFISGLLIVGLSAPQAPSWTHETATVRTWQWLDRRDAGHL